MACLGSPMRTRVASEPVLVGPEGPAHDLPLDGVGVLELVDQGHPVALPQAPAGGGARLAVGQGVAQAGEQVVVGEEGGPAFAGVDLGPDPLRQADPEALVGVGGARRFDGGPEVLDRDLADLERRLAVEGEGEAGPVELAHVEVVDHLGHQVVDDLDEGGVALHVAGHAQAFEDVLAEPVGGDDGGGVEAGQGFGQVLRRASISSRVPWARRHRTVSSGGGVTPRRAQSRPASALTRRWRTRSRSSPVAMRVKVTMSSWCSGVPPAT